MKKGLHLCIALTSFFSVSAQQWNLAQVTRPRDINTIHIFSHDHLLAAGGNRTNDSIQSLFISRTGGIDWDITLDVLSSWIKSVHFKDSLNGIAASYGGRIFKTADGGDQWTRVPSPINRDFNKVFFIDSLTGFIAGGKDDVAQTILKTTNGGQSWSVVHDQTGFMLQSIFFTDANNGVAVGDSALILQTTNGGANWTPVSSPIQRDFNAIWFTDANNGVIVGGNFTRDSIRTILTTNNGGSSWSVLSDQLGGWLTDVYFVDQTTGYAVGAFATLLKTTNGGQNWSTETVSAAVSGDNFLSVKFDGPDFGVIGSRTGKMFVYSSDPFPDVYTLGSQSVTTTTATMLCGVNTHGSFAYYSFLFSTSSNLAGASESIPQIVLSDSVVQRSASVSLLTPNTTYYFVAKARTLAGSVYGDTLSFYTGMLGTEFHTLDATNIHSGTSAQLNGTVDGFTQVVTLSFQYGLTPSLGSEVAASPATVSDNQRHSVSATINSLTPGAIYYFRLKGVTASGTVYGDTRAFYAGKLFTALETQLPTVVSDTSVLVFGMVAGFKIPATIGFDYAIDTMDFAYRTFMGPDTLVTDTLQHNFQTNIMGLTPGKVYYYRIRAKTSIGTYYGDTIAFFTGPNADIHFQTLSATDVEATSAQLNGSIEKFDLPVTLSFQYSTDLSFNNEIAAAPGSINDTLSHSISATVTGLQDHTLYHFRVKAETADGAHFLGNTKQVFTGESTIANWDFQEWEMDTALLASGWNFAGNIERAPGHSSDYAMKLHGQTIALLGYFREEDDGPIFFGGIPINARPDSIIMFMDYMIEPGDTGFLIVNFNSGTTILGGGFINITGNSGGGFQRMAFPIDYTSPATPDSVAVGFAATNPNGKVQTSSYLTVDDISFSNAPATVVQYCDFENWFEYEHEELQTWFYNGYIAVDTVSGSKMVTKAIFSYPDDYAAEIRNRSWEGGYVEGALSTAPNFNDHYPSIGLSARHQTLNGYYQYYPVNGDTMEIEIMIFHGDSAIGTSIFRQTDTVSTFTPLEVPLTYYNNSSALPPDSANIRINCSTRYVNGESRLLIDKLRFDGFAHADLTDIVEVKKQVGIKLFPNPSAAIVNVQLQNEITGILEIYSLNGRTVYSQKFTGSQLQVNTADFPQGIYFVSIFENGKRVTNKLMVIR